MSRAKWSSVWMVCAAMLAGGGHALAANPPCSSLPNPIYVGGSSAVQPIIALMAKALGQQGTDTLVYVSKGSCVGAGAVVNDTTPLGACANGACFTDAGVTYYDNTGTAKTCDLDPKGTHLDVGTSDVFVTTCPGLDANLIAKTVDVSAFAQAMLFVAPKLSTQTAITAEEGYFLFGFGAAGMVTPWNMDPAKFSHIRNGNSGTQNIIAYRLGIVPAAKMKGKDEGGSGGVLNGVIADNNSSPENSIGIIAAEFYDRNRSMLNALAFRGFKQYFAYYADSSAASFDKKNVRDGHYLPWGYLHMVMQVDANKKIVRPNAQKFNDWMLGATKGPWDDATHTIDDLVLGGRGIPACAMNVSITKEGDDLKWSPPANPCGCWFDATVPGGSTTCTKCVDNTPCGAGTCRHGFCEAR